MTISDHMILGDGTLFATSAIGNVNLAEDPAYGLYVADTRLLSELASTYGVTNPINRVLAALQIP